MFTTSKSLETILGTFSKVQDDLVNFIDRNRAETVKLDAAVTDLMAQAAAKSSEIARASSVLKKIEALVK